MKQFQQLQMDKKTEKNYNRLPEQKHERQQLKYAILRMIKRIQKVEGDNWEHNSSIKTLSLRLQLIDGCSQMTLLRLNHLEEIFKHYCTHIFKIGKHMTFDRLQYEKTHLTMERFFLFVRDFQLNAIEVEGKKEQVLEKNTIILIFKKISSNCKDLSFEEFVNCIEKIAIKYYDQKLIFPEKKEKIRQEKQKRKQELERRKYKKSKKTSEEEQQQKEENEEQDQSSEKPEENEENNSAQEKDEESQEKNEDKNDELVKDMMNDQNLENPNEEISKIKNRYAEDSQLEENSQTERDVQYEDEILLLLTMDQKIQYYYRIMIRVDNVADYRKRMTELNLPIFQKQQKTKQKTQSKNEGQIFKKKIQAEELSKQQFIIGMQELKKKIDEKKSKQKSLPVPKPSEDPQKLKIQEQRKKKMELKRQRQEKVKNNKKEQSDEISQKKKDAFKIAKEKEKGKEIDLINKEISWLTLGKLSIDQLNFKRFNPNKFYHKDEDDNIYLDEYDRGNRRLKSGIRERHSVSVVEEAKKRAHEVEKKQKNQDKQLDNLSKKIGLKAGIKNKF